MQTAQVTRKRLKKQNKTKNQYHLCHSYTIKEIRIQTFKALVIFWFRYESHITMSKANIWDTIGNFMFLFSFPLMVLGIKPRTLYHWASSLGCQRNFKSSRTSIMTFLYRFSEFINNKNVLFSPYICDSMNYVIQKEDETAGHF